jgi:hypothetical protein
MSGARSRSWTSLRSWLQLWIKGNSPMQIFGRNQTFSSADPWGWSLTSPQPEVHSSLQPPPSSQVFSGVGAVPPSRPERYLSGATAVTLWLFGAGSWHWVSGCDSEETTPRGRPRKVLRTLRRTHRLRFQSLLSIADGSEQSLRVRRNKEE